MDSLKQLLGNAFNLSDDNASQDEIKKQLMNGANIRGTNMAILFLAIMIASIGLNMNSTAVIIGAMLISPLMGSIMGIAYGMATANIAIVRKCVFGFLLQILISLVTSILYFSITPISSSTSELLARTEPTIWDVMIATFGGFAGIIGVTRKEKTNIIPGVAIATALMPPLCTAGYGIATGQIVYALGAFYLFALNSYFICLTSVLVLVVLKVPKEAMIESRNSMRRKIVKFSIVTFVMLIPSVLIAYKIVQDKNTTGFIPKSTVVTDVSQEAKVLFPEIEYLDYGSLESAGTTEDIAKTKLIVYVNDSYQDENKDTIADWLKLRMKTVEEVSIVKELD